MVVLTIGHSTHEEGEFLALLRSAGVELLVDVRAYPASRRVPHFNSRELAATRRVRARLARRITATHTPAQSRIILVDHRRSLLGEVPASHLLGHGTDSTTTRRLMTEATEGMKERVPGPEVTAPLNSAIWPNRTSSRLRTARRGSARARLGNE